MLAAYAATLATTGASVIPLSAADLATVTGGICYVDDTRNCQGTPKGCADGNCNPMMVNGVVVFYCDDTTGELELADEYSDTYQSSGSGLEDEQTMEPIYCYQNQTCSEVCNAPKGQPMVCYVAQGGDNGPLVWPTTATGDECEGE